MANLTRLRALALAALTVAAWPLSVFFLCLNYAILITSPRKSLRSSLRQIPGFRARRVLITGSTPAALRLARAFHETGHHVTLAAYRPNALPVHTKWSIASPIYVRLRRAPSTDALADYIHELLGIVETAGIEIWIDATSNTPTSALFMAKSVIERKTNCLVFAPEERASSVFRGRASFLEFASTHGLPVPEQHVVKSRDDIHKILNQSRGKQQYVLSETNGSLTTKPQTLLPRRTLSQTYDEVARIKIQHNSQMRLDQTLEDGDAYQSTTVAVRGVVEAFAACKMNDAGRRAAIPPTSVISDAMLQFHQHFANELKDYTGHITIDFCIDEKSLNQSIQKRVLPVSGRCITDTTLVFFHGVEGSISLVRSYISVFGRGANGFIRGSDEVLIPGVAPGHERGVYGFGHAVYNLLLVPAIQLLTLDTSFFYVLGSGIAFAKQLCFWHEAIYDFNDPLPFFYFYLIYVPVQLLLGALNGTTGAVVAELQEMSL